MAATFADQSFEIVYSNSVIEHLGMAEDQRKFADQLRRVGPFIAVKRSSEQGCGLPLFVISEKRSLPMAHPVLMINPR